MVGIRAGDIGGEASIDIHADETIGGRRPACMNTNVLPAASETPLADQWKMSELGLVDIQIVAWGIRARRNSVLEQNRRAFNPFLVKLAEGCLGWIDIREILWEVEGERIPVLVSHLT